MQTDICGNVGLFFYISGKFLVSKCPLQEAEKYGDFHVYPYSHDEIWRRSYYNKYQVDFDYFPRGRVVYHLPDNTFFVYCDSCIKENIGKIVVSFSIKNYELKSDEHYLCHMCNKSYLSC